MGRSSLPGNSVSASSRRSSPHDRASLGKQLLPPAACGGAQHPAGQAQIQPTQENGSLALAGRYACGRSPLRQVLARAHQVSDPCRPICQAPSYARPPAPECMLDRRRVRRRHRRGRIQEGMDTLLDCRCIQRPDLVMDHQARAGRIRPDPQDTGLSTESGFEAVRDTSILMQGRNAQSQAPARLMTHLHLGSVPIDSALKITCAILIRIIRNNKFAGDRAVSDAAGLRTSSHHPETSFHRRLSSDPARPASPSTAMKMPSSEMAPPRSSRANAT